MVIELDVRHHGDLRPQLVRDSYDVSSLQFVVHAAAPCAVSVKGRMMDWFGPIIHEYYSGTEDIGFAAITPEAKSQIKKPAGNAMDRIRRQRMLLVTRLK